MENAPIDTELPQSFCDAFTTLFNGLSLLSKGETAPASATDGEDSTVPDGDLESLLRQLQQMLTQGDPEARQLLGPLKRLLSEPKQLEQLKQIRAQLDNYDFDNALLNLKELSATLTGKKR